MNEWMNELMDRRRLQHDEHREWLSHASTSLRASISLASKSKLCRIPVYQYQAHKNITCTFLTYRIRLSDYGRLKFDILKSEYYLREFQNRPLEIENRPLEIENRPHFVKCPISSCTDEPHLERVNSSTTFLVSAVLKGLIPQFYIHTPSSSII